MNNERFFKDPNVAKHLSHFHDKCVCKSHYIDCPGLPNPNYIPSFRKEEFEDTKGVIRIRISKKNRQHSGQKKKYKRTNNDLQNIHKTKDRVTRTPLKTRGELR
jgi:hypothetical protein